MEGGTIARARARGKLEDKVKSIAVVRVCSPRYWGLCCQVLWSTTEGA